MLVHVNHVNYINKIRIFIAIMPDTVLIDALLYRNSLHIKRQLITLELKLLIIFNLVLRLYLIVLNLYKPLC